MSGEMGVSRQDQILGWAGEIGQRARWQPSETLCLASSAPRMNTTTSWSTVAGAQTGYLLSKLQNLSLVTPFDLIDFLIK